jgi:hypothetical protein
MTTLEHEQPLVTARWPAASDPHVFAAANVRRARALRLTGICAGMLSLAWLGALAVALLGAGAVPGALPVAKARGPAPRSAPTPVLRHAQAQRVDARARRITPAASRRTPQTAVPAHSPTQVASDLPATVTPPHAAVALPVPAPAASRQGWVRRGWTARPGRVKREAAPHRSGGKSGDAGATAPGQSGSRGRNSR